MRDKPKRKKTVTDFGPLKIDAMSSSFDSEESYHNPYIKRRDRNGKTIIKKKRMNTKSLIEKLREMHPELDTSRRGSDYSDTDLRHCTMSEVFVRLKKKYEGLRLKNKIKFEREDEKRKAERKRVREIMRYFGVNASKKILHGSLTRQQKIKRKINRRMSSVPQYFASEFISKRKLKELRSKKK